MNRISVLTILLWALIPAAARAQPAADSTADNSLVALPLVFLTPETSWGFGAAGVFTFRFAGEAPETRPSQLQLGGAYTLENQLLSYLPFQLFWDGERNNVYGELGYYRYTYFYYGIGNGFEDYEGELFDLAFPRVRLNLARRALGRWYLGLRYWLDDNRVSGTEPDGLLEQNAPVGSQGGLVSGAGPLALLDQRDNVFYPTSGPYLEAAVLHNAAWTGSDFVFTKVTVDARQYWSRDSSAVWALNAYMEFNSGQPPFTQLALMGGTRRMRGYYEGRYRDRHLMVLQGEYRFPLFWRLKGTVFGGLGNVAGTLMGFRLDNTRYTLGAGLRFLLLPEERAHVRLDYGFGNNTSGFYLTVGEAF